MNYLYGRNPNWMFYGWMAGKKAYSISGHLHKKRNLLDLYESYKYMNSTIPPDFLGYEDGRWEYPRGWLELNVNLREWGFLNDEGQRLFPRIPVSST